MKPVHGLAFAAALVLLAFQNCSDKIQLVAPSAPISSQASATTTTFCMNNPTNPSCTNTQAPTCMFNGSLVPQGGQVTAFQNPAPVSGGICVAEFRNCNNGTLSGSYQYASCSAGNQGACLFNGQTIANGQSVTAYLASAIANGQSCTSQQRTCVNGVLLGSYSFSTCQAGAAASCLFNNQTFAANSTVMTYPISVPFGTDCRNTTLGQLATCQNGTMVNALPSLTCTVAPASSCTFNNTTYSDGQQFFGYTVSSVSYGSLCTDPGIQETLTCSNGTVLGQTLNPDFGTCTVAAAANCLLPGDNTTVANGSTVNAYLLASQAACASYQQRTCTNGTLSGSSLYQYGVCTSYGTGGTGGGGGGGKLQ
jgi:hypothetical protein